METDSPEAKPASPPRRRKRLFLLVLPFLLVGLALACFLWVGAQQRQYALNRALVKALVLLDFQPAQKLVEAGADPNTPINPPPTPTWPVLLRQLLHLDPPSVNTCPSAFMAVCWTNWLAEYRGTEDIQIPDNRWTPRGYGKDDNARKIRVPARLYNDPQTTQLALVMIAHGANVNATDGRRGWTALMMVSAFGVTDRMSLLLE